LTAEKPGILPYILLLRSGHKPSVERWGGGGRRGGVLRLYSKRNVHGVRGAGGARKGVGADYMS
jgi:hypothetical protein